MSEIENQITQYLSCGGMFNPELMEHHKVSDLLLKCRDEIQRLKEKCDRQAMVIRRVYVEEWPGTWFAWHGYGGEDNNGLPKFIEVIPCHGVGWSQIYERTDRTVSMEGS